MSSPAAARMQAYQANHDQVSGWVDILTFETMVEVEVCGIHLGVFHGIASQTLQIDLALQLVVGNLKLEMNAFDDIWVHIDNLPGEKGKAVEALNCKRSVLAQHLQELPCEPWVPVR
ncbi:hypothetical protein P170DRAFT_477227 [Aspergillus steynii IBT 23096]|uniref:Uncharacterized protein n=1 Tax=Aspergillus steynii IBT 23096 TaxID=1392250 RepID=A0A2I2G0D1_9EURO|nr:uncharacterized protein P170DRAFT_477227 [Aspergillus steynii IBT 23096]PLB46345.1 hypothetical protein P170DRAFT_477227 [Aspergillus steynii IBT 23096]